MAQAEAAELAAHVGDVGVGGDGGVGAGLDGILLGRQAERVEAHRVQHVVAGHPLVAGEHVGADVAERMADVQTDARRVREHVLDEQLLAALGDEIRIAEWPGRVRRLEHAVLLPAVLPADLDLLGELGGVAVRRGVGGGGAGLVAHTGLQS